MSIVMHAKTQAEYYYQGCRVLSSSKSYLAVKLDNCNGKF